MSRNDQRLGILAGGGNLPLEVARQAKASGRDPYIVAIDGEADADFSEFPVTRLNWGKIGKIISTFRANTITDLIILGSVSRPDIKKIRPDFGLIRNLPRILKMVRAGGDDNILRMVISFFEDQGFRVLGLKDVAPELLIGSGPIGRERASEDDYRDVAIGFDIIRRIGKFDVGQGVVVADGTVEAIEGAEGTDRMLQRVAHLRVTKYAKTQRGILVKRPKPNQELRVDLPTIGPGTAEHATRAGLSGIAVLQHAAITAQRDKLIRDADDSQLFIEGCADDANEAAASDDFDIDISFVQLGTVAMSRSDDEDLRHAVGVLEALAPFEIGGAVAVARRHVLAIEVGEGLEAFVERVKTLRQWGGGIGGKGVGMAIFGSAKPFGTQLVAAAEEAGLKGVIIASDALSKTEWSTAIVNANTRNLFIGALTVSNRNA